MGACSFRAPMLLLFIASLLFPVLAAAGKAETSKAALDQLHSRIETLKKELDSTREAHTEAADALKQSEQAISETNRKLYELLLRQRENSKTLQTLESEKSGLEQTIHQQQELLGKQLYQQYLKGHQSYAQIILSQGDPTDIARELHYLGYVSRARFQLIESLKKNLAHIASLNEATASTLLEITALKTEQQQQRKKLQAIKTERRSVMQKLTKQIKSQRGEISKLKRDEKRLSQLVERLARIITSTPKRARDMEKTRRNEALPTSALDGLNFESLKGKLNLPVRGNVTNRFGAAREDSGIAWKGLFIKTGEGEEVRSVASGRVVFADWLRGFGNLLIVDHGNNYMSLYGNNQTLLKGVGDAVTAGDAIAAVGSTGGNEDSGLYFELRHQSKPFDPLAWCIVK